MPELPITAPLWLQLIIFVLSGGIAWNVIEYLMDWRTQSAELRKSDFDLGAEYKDELRADIDSLRDRLAQIEVQLLEEKIQRVKVESQNRKLREKMDSMQTSIMDLLQMVDDLRDEMNIAPLPADE